MWCCECAFPFEGRLFHFSLCYQWGLISSPHCSVFLNGSRLTKPQSFADCLGNELPFGWEECYDEQVGVYYVDHSNSEFFTLMHFSVALVKYQMICVTRLDYAGWWEHIWWILDAAEAGNLKGTRRYGAQKHTKVLLVCPHALCLLGSCLWIGQLPKFLNQNFTWALNHLTIVTPPLLLPL